MIHETDAPLDEQEGRLPVGNHPAAGPSEIEPRVEGSSEGVGIKSGNDVPKQLLNAKRGTSQPTVIKGVVRVLGGNGVAGVCRMCEDVVPLHRDGDGYTCGNDHAPAAERRLTSRSWRPTKRHVLLGPLETSWAEGVEGPDLQPWPKDLAFCRRCREAVVVLSTGCGRSPWPATPVLWSDPQTTP